MALADELVKQATERFTLVKITPRYRVNDDLSVKSGTVLEATLDYEYEISSVEENGSALSESSTANPSNGEYYWDRSTKTFEINVNDATPATELIIKYVIRLTDSPLSSYSETGVFNSVSSYHWESRLANSPSVNTSVKNFIAGVPTIEATNVVVANEDGWLDTFLAGENSWFDCPIEITIFIEETEFASFFGNVRNVNKDTNQVRINSYDGNSPFLSPCLMGDTYQDSFYNVDNFGTTFDRRFEGRPIPFVFGRSYYRLEPAKDFNTSGNLLGRMDQLATMEAVCTSTNNSHEWTLCRTSSAGVKVKDYGTVSTVTVEILTTVNYGNGTGNRNLFTITTNDDHNLELWDTVSIEKSSTFYEGVVTRLGTNSGGDQTIEGFITDSSPATGNFDGVETSPGTALGIMIVQAGVPYFPDSINDYTISTSTLSSGNKLVKVTFGGSFESRHPGLNPLNYQEHRIFFRFTEDTATNDYTTENEAFDAIVESVGMTAGTHDSSDDNVNFQIPAFGDTTYRDVGEYIGLLAESRFAYAIQNSNNGNIEFKKFAAPSSTNLVREDEILEGSLSLEFDGNEMGKELQIKNDHSYFQLNYEYLGAGPIRGYGDRTNYKTYSHNVTSDKSTYFHGLTNTKTLDTVYIDTSTRATAKTAILENEQMIVTFATSTKHGDLTIGDSISVEHSIIPGTKSTLNGFSVTDLVIIGVEKSADRVTFTGINFKGLS